MKCEICGRSISSKKALIAATMEADFAKSQLLLEARLLAADDSRSHEWIVNASKNLLAAEKHLVEHRLAT